MYYFSKLKRNNKILHGISEISDGDMAFNFLKKEEVVKNRLVFLQKNSMDINKCVSITVMHSNKVVVVDKKDYKKGMYDWKTGLKCDALVTNAKGVNLFLKTADCAPVILYEPAKNVLALIHIGWKNVENRTLEKVVNICNVRYKTCCKNFQVYIGPCARKNSYLKKDPKQLQKTMWKRYLTKTTENTYKVDFVGFFKWQLLKLGFVNKYIFDCGINTISNKRFYSHYRFTNSLIRNDTQGRFATVVGMKE